jgi:hypothetical protein
MTQSKSMAAWPPETTQSRGMAAQVQEAEGARALGRAEGSWVHVK